MFDTLKTRIGAWLLYRLTVNKLDDLDDRTLLDMGIPRARIRRHAHATVFGPGDPRR